jgi:hypothetical protein
VEVFPLPVLGVLLFFEALALMRFIRSEASDAGSLFIVLLVGLIASGVPYGYAIGLVVGAVLYHVRERFV